MVCHFKVILLHHKTVVRLDSVKKILLTWISLLSNVSKLLQFKQCFCVNVLQEIIYSK